MTDTRLLTADELAERWQVAKAHVYRLAREDQIPTVRIGRYFRFRLAAIEAWEMDQDGAGRSPNPSDLPADAGAQRAVPRTESRGGRIRAA